MNCVPESVIVPGLTIDRLPLISAVYQQFFINKRKLILAIDKQFFKNKQNLKAHRMMLDLHARMRDSAYTNAENTDKSQTEIILDKKRLAIVNKEARKFLLDNKKDIQLLLASTPIERKDGASQNKKAFTTNECLLHLLCLPCLPYLSILPPKKRNLSHLSCLPPKNECLPLKKRKKRTGTSLEATREAKRIKLMPNQADIKQIFKLTPTQEDIIKRNIYTKDKTVQQIKDKKIVRSSKRTKRSTRDSNFVY